MATNGTAALTDTLTVPRTERHVLRVFALDMDDDAVGRLRNRPDGDEPLARIDPSLHHADRAAVAALFGLDDIDPARVELVDIDDLADVGLAAYLIEGDAAAEDQILADRARLNALRGRVLTVPSAAIAGRPVTLRLAPGVTLIGAYAEEVPPVRFDPLPDASARKTAVDSPVAGPPETGYRSGLLVGATLLALLVLAALAVLLIG